MSLKSQCTELVLLKILQMFRKIDDIRSHSEDINDHEHTFFQKAHTHMASIIYRNRFISMTVEKSFTVLIHLITTILKIS